MFEEKFKRHFKVRIKTFKLSKEYFQGLVTGNVMESKINID